MRVAIIGGGIAGLSAAYELELARQVGNPVEYELFEAGPRLGGVISSSIVDGTVIEHGPDSFLTEKPAAAELCRELGLTEDLLPSNDAERRTYILIRNRLVPLPDGLMFLVPTRLLPTLLTPLFSLPTKLRMALELLHRKRPRSSDESVAALVKRHYGQEVVDRLADPLLSGIYGGDATQLSAQSVLARFVDMEAQYGSLTRGMVSGMRKRKAAAGRSDEEDVAQPAIFTTLRYGLQQLIDVLIGCLDTDRLHLETAITGVAHSPDGWTITACGEHSTFDAVIVATPAWSAAKLLASANPALSSELGDIPYSSSVTVNLVYDGVDLDPMPPGFGFLVPATEKRAILACTFIHRKFPGRTAPGKTVLRAFLGGAHNAALVDESDEALASLVRKELRQILEISAKPELIEIQRWPRAMAQYAVGHKERMQRIQNLTGLLHGLYLIGNAYDGIGISDCIRLGRTAARAIASTPLAAPATAQSHT